MTQTVEERIELLEQFDELLEREFAGNHGREGSDKLRKQINKLVPLARSFIIEAKCMKKVSATPPPAIGGPILRNVDPFDMLFEDYYGMSFIPTIRDMTQRAIGVLNAGEIEMAVGENEEEHVVYKQLDIPEKVTLGWLVHNVPIKLWGLAGGLLVAAFFLGIKASTWNFVREMLGMPPCA